MPRSVTVAGVSAGIENSIASQPPTAEQHVKRILDCIERIAPVKPDLISLPETFHAANVPGRCDENAITADHEIVHRVAAAAKKSNCNIICPILERRSTYVFNTALWIDRKGQVAGRYDKIHPTETEIDLGVTCGLSKPTIWATDFGKVGVQTCFDINWPNGWSDLKHAGAELIVWPSAYAGGRQLAAHAFFNHVFVLTATYPRSCRVHDINGDIIAQCGRLANFIIATIDLDRRLFHWDYQGERLDKIRAKYGRDVHIDIYHEEGWFALHTLRDGLSVTDLIHEFDLVPLDRYLPRAAQKQDEHRPTRPIG